jgi:transposase
VELPAVTCEHELPGGAPFCPRCGKPFRGFGTQDSYEIEFEVRVYRRVHRRARYVPDCTCDQALAVVTAPVVPKVIPKGMLGISLWVHILLEKWDSCGEFLVLTSSG